MNRDTPYPLRMPPELREVYQAMAEQSGDSLHSELLRALYKQAEGFEVIETSDQAIAALRLLNEHAQALHKEQKSIIDMLSDLD